MMGLNREFRLSSQCNSGLPRSERVVDLLRWCDATVYLCARGSFNYMYDDGVFPVNGIDVLFQNFLPPTYPQCAARGKFIPYLSFLDMLFNIGPAAARELVETSSNNWLTWDDMVAACDRHSADESAEFDPSQEHV